MLSLRLWSFYAPVLVLAGCFAGCGGGGGAQIQVPTTPAPTATAPIPSGRVAFMSNRDGAFHLYVMNGDGSGQVRFTKNAGLERSPSWSADGRSLVFSYSPDGSLKGAEIYSLQSDGTHLTRLTNNLVEDTAPSLSRDGQFLTWAQVASAGAGAIWIARGDGTQARQLTASTELARTPSFDAQNRVLFASRQENQTGAGGKYQIVRVNADGTGRTQISEGNSNHSTPAISPDGATIAFLNDVSGDLRLCVSPINAVSSQPLPSSAPDDSDPCWTPDGRLIFSSARDGNFEIYSCNANGTSLRRLTDSAGIDRLPSAR